MKSKNKSEKDFLCPRNQFVNPIGLSIMVIRKADNGKSFISSMEVNLMGSKMLILSPIITLILLTTNSYAILDPSEIGSSGGSSLADTL